VPPSPNLKTETDPVSETPFSSYSELQKLGKVHKTIDSERYTSSSKPLRFYGHLIIFFLTSLKRHGMSDRKTPDSKASTWPPTYVSWSRTCPSLVILLSSDFCLFGKMMRAWKASTMSKASHRVPEPFLSTYNKSSKLRTPTKINNTVM
jgi:hypothetical protein